MAIDYSEDIDKTDEEIEAEAQQKATAAAAQVEWKEFEDNEDAVAHIFSKKHIKTELVEVPEWEMKVEIRGLPAGHRNLLLQRHMGKDGKPDLVKMYPDLVIASAYNPKTGKKLFVPAHRERLNEDGGDIIDKLAMVASRLSGLDADAIEKARKNS